MIKLEMMMNELIHLKMCQSLDQGTKYLVTIPDDIISGR